MSLIYKTLFEIKLMHEYFLTRQDGHTVFEKNLQQDRLDFLLKEFREERDPVNDTIDFKFPQTLQSTYEGFGLKILPTYSGCRIAIRVNQKKLPDQSLVYEPAVAFPAGQHIYILLTRKGNPIDAFSNSRVIRSYPAYYYFSNTDILGPKTFPFLTNSIPAFDSGYTYEQGELAFNGTDIQEYYNDAGVDTWNTITGTGFVNESDRMLLPAGFPYSFTDTTGLTDAEIKLKDKDGNEIASVTKTDPAGLSRELMLDFSGKIKTLPGNDSFVASDLVYTLEVNGNNGYTRTHRVLFADELLKDNPWALVHINATASPAFNLFANDGFLVCRKNALGVATPAPIFEIPVKSRLVYWRFVHDKGGELKVSPTLTGYVNKEDKALVTKRPRPLAKDFFLLHKQGSADTVYVPNPPDTLLTPGSGKRLFLDIRVPQSDLFPVIP